MPLTLTEKLDSRKWNTGENPSVELVYQLRGTCDDITAKLLIENSTPKSYNGLERQSIDLSPEWVNANALDGLWNAVVRYGLKAPPQVGQSSFNFDTGGGTQHITQAKATIGNFVVPNGKPADFQGAINYVNDGANCHVDGVDITLPVYVFSETHYLPDAVVTEAYRGQLFHLTGKVNNGPFKGCAAGECLFLGACGSKRGAEDWEITFKFAGSPNRQNIPASEMGGISGVSKKGWEYAWVFYEPHVDETRLLLGAVQVTVVRVYDEGDFSKLGIGT